MIASDAIDLKAPAIRISPRAKPVVDHLVELIRHGQLAAGDRVPAIRDLASIHNVSFTIARQAVLKLEQDGVLERVQGSGTYVRGAQRVAPTASADGPLTHDTAYLFTERRPHTSAALNSHMADALMRRVIPFVECCDWGRTFARSSSRVLDLWSTHAPRAIVLQYVDTRRDELIAAAAPQGTRIIGSFRTGVWDPPSWHAVNPDYFNAFRLAAEHVIAQGHRRIGVLTKRRIVAPNWPHTLRRSRMWETQQLLGAGAAVRAAGRDCRMTTLVNLPVAKDPSGIPIDEDNLQRMVVWLTGPDRPTAVVGEDFRIIGLRRAAKRAGLSIPDDLALVAVGGSPISFALDLPYVDLRYDLVAQQIVDLIEADDASLGGAVREVKVPPRLVLPNE